MLRAMDAARKIDIGVFAWNEEGAIGALIETLVRQDAFARPDLSVRVVICANGCTDGTVGAARRAVADLGQAGSWEVLDLAQGGKSRTWNHFVHEVSRADADALIFCDADIEIPERGVLSGLADFLRDHSAVLAASSRPVKDIVHRPKNPSFQDRIIAAAGGTLDDWRRSICGQLYVMRAKTARGFHLPVGLPVEDGFVRAMTLTNVFREPEHFDRIDGDGGLSHVYRSERTVPALIRHQLRLVIGSAINTVVYSALSASADPVGLLRQASADPGWLDALLREAPPRRYGYVPAHFLFKRLSRFGAASLKRKPIILLGWGFDAVVYVLSQVRMARGVGAGHW